MTKPDVKRAGLRDQLRHVLVKLFARRFATSGATEVKIVDDLILLRCKGALSSSEVDLVSMKSGRLLLQEVSERTCQELKPELDRLLYRVTGLRLVDLCVGLFFERREKIYILTMSDRLKQ